MSNINERINDEFTVADVSDEMKKIVKWNRDQVDAEIARLEHERSKASEWNARLLRQKIFLLLMSKRTLNMTLGESVELTEEFRPDLEGIEKQTLRDERIEAKRRKEEPSLIVVRNFRPSDSF